MINQQQICEAFCSGVTIKPVPVGLAVSTSFVGMNGDNISFYVTRSPDNARYRLEDSGLIVPELEGAGFNLKKGTRAEAFSNLLSEYGAHLDNDTLEIQTDYIEESQVPSVALQFIAMLLRIQDLFLLNQKQVATTFVEDARHALQKHFLGKAEIDLKSGDIAHYPDFKADAVIKKEGFPQTAIYFGTSVSRIEEAIILRLDSRLNHRALRVIALLEMARSDKVPDRILAMANNRLDAVPIFRGHEFEAMEKIESTAFSVEGYYGNA